MRRLKIAWVLTFAMWLGILAVPSIFAQGAPPDGFKVMDPNAPHETIPHTQLVLAAYAFVWLALIFYVWSVWRRLIRVERELAGVTQQLRERRR